MNLNPFADWFINESYFEDSLQLKRARLLVKSSFLTSLFSTSYLILALYVECQVGFYSMIFNVLGFLLLPFVLRKKVDLILLGNVFIFMGAFAIALTTHFTGGLKSPILWWLAAAPVLAAFLVNRKSAIVWGVLMYGLTMFYGVAELVGYAFPQDYNLEMRSLFVVISSSGFLLIILVIAMIFEFNTRQALVDLNKANEQMKGLNAEKDYVIHIMAHDLRNPLSVVKSLIELLKEKVNLKKSQDEIYDMMGESIDRSLGLIDKVTKTGAIEQEKLLVKLEDLDISSAIAEVVDGYKSKAAEKEIRLESTLEEEELKANIDTMYFIQILDNLVSNALKYTRKGGHVMVKAMKSEFNIRIEVLDEGPGLSKAQIAQLFQKFGKVEVQPTGGEGSTGLGLFLVKKYTDLMNGKVWCESEIGKGSKFILELPSS